MILFVLKTVSLNNLPIYSIAVLATVIILYTASLVLIYLIAGSLYLLIIFLRFPFLPPSASDNHKSGLFYYEFVLFLDSIYEITQYLSFSDLFHIAKCLQVPSMSS